MKPDEALSSTMMELSFDSRSTVNIENRGPTLLIINGVVTGVAALVVGLRVASRLLIVKRFGADDCTILAAITTAIMNVVVAGLGVQHGTGKHRWDLSKEDALPAAKLRFVTHIIYTLITALIKASICLLYLRLFPNIRLLTIGTLVFVSSMSLAIILATIFQCSPVDAIYNDQKYTNYRCFPSIPFWYAGAALALATDFWILVLPVPIVLGLKMGNRKRYILMGLLSLGGIACIASIIRMVYIVKLYQSFDPSWDTFGVSISSGIEIAVAIMAASIPGTRPIVDKMFPRLFASTVDRGGATSQRYGTISAVERRRHQSRSEIPLSVFSSKWDREGDRGDDDSMKAIARA